MKLSIRETIIQAIQARLADGVGVACLRVPRAQRDYEDDVLLGLIDEEDVPESIEYGAIRRVMRVTVQYVRKLEAPDYDNESAVANAMLAEIESLLTGIDPTLSGLALGTRYAAGTPAYDATVASDYAAAVAAFEVTYQTDIGDPYTDSNPH